MNRIPAGAVSPVSPVADRGRRRFVCGLAAASVGAGLGLHRLPAWAAGHAGLSGILPGTDVDLDIGHTAVNYTGRTRQAVTVNGSLPAPTLRWREGDTVTLRVTNRLAEDTSIHWHGILVPSDMDGVPGLSFPGIAPGETFTYRFPVRQSGTYWYHSHSGHQEQLGLYGAIIIDPREPEPFTWDREYVVMLSDWTDEAPARVYAQLKKQSDYYNRNQRTVADLWRDARRNGWRATLAERAAWGEMRMNPSDLADLSAQTYTYLMNGVTPAGNWTGLFRAGERVRLRLINAGTMTFFDLRIPGLDMTVVTADGQPVRPVTVEELRMGSAECYDVIVTPREDRAYTVFAQSADRTGYACGTLAPVAGMRAAIPPLDRRPVLTMADMGHGDHAAHGDHASHAPAATGAHEGHDSHDGHAAAAAPHLTPETIRHAPTEYGPTVDMRVDRPSNRLDDPGVGLRDNGRRVLTYADLVARDGDPDGREPTRTIELHITGHMERYIWSFNGVKASAAEPVYLAHGERVRFVLVNDTMMEHPIHLHGLWSDLEDESGRFKLRKHTLAVKPAQMISFRVGADTPGLWAFHCHLLLHMVAGMFRMIVVDDHDPGSGAPPPDGAPGHDHDAQGHGGHDHA